MPPPGVGSTKSVDLLGYAVLKLGVGHEAIARVRIRVRVRARS